MSLVKDVLSLKGVGGVLVGVALVIAALALFLGDDGTEEVLDRLSRAGGVQVTGRWQGMYLADPSSAAAREFPILPTTQGIALVDLAEGMRGQRAKVAGLREGDLITAVEGKRVASVAQLIKVVRNIDGAGPIMLEVVRWGQPMNLVLPAMPAPVPAASAQAPGVGGPPIAPLPMPAGPAPAAWVPAANQPQLFCPAHGVIHPASAGPYFRCPRCSGPLMNGAGAR